MAGREPSESYQDCLSVFGALDTNLAQSSQHVLAHMRQHQPFAAQLAPSLHQRRVVQVKPDLLFEEIRLTDEQVSALSNCHERIRPFRITGIGDRSPLTLDPER